MSFCLRSWLTGFALGLSGKPYPYSKREPTAYLYNGIRLPALPEWDREKYPYAIIFHSASGINNLFISATPWHGTGKAFDDFGGTFGETTANASSGILYNQYNDKDWELMSNEDTPPELGQIADTDGDGVGDAGAFCTFWSNHDIISADGTTVLIAASDPVPVYE